MQDVCEPSFPQADWWPWVQALADPAGSKAALQSSSPTPAMPGALETPRDFTLFDKIGDGM